MFLIAGISSKTVLVDKKPKLCPICGLARAYYRRTDQYFSLFFIPLFRVKKGEAFIMCDKCEQEVKEYGFEHASFQACKKEICKDCGKALQGDFKYCPYCGKPK